MSTLDDKQKEHGSTEVSVGAPSVEHDERSEQHDEKSEQHDDGSEQDPCVVQETYDDDKLNSELINQIKQYADEIKCSDFHGKGTIEDYKSLFQAASKITDDVKSMKTNIDVDGFYEFGQAADNLSALFESFTLKLQNLTIVDNNDFLKTVAESLAKIVNLSNVFGRFKKTISSTAKIQIPKSIKDATVAVSSVVDEVSCAMGYISYFVDPATTGKMPNAELIQADKKAIQTAVDFINNWENTCTEELSETMENNKDVIFLKQSNTDLKLKTATLKKLTNSLKSKIDNIKTLAI